MKAIILLISCLSLDAQALEQIIRPMQSVRSAGMGGVRITTGQFDDNIFGNPARVTQDPHYKLHLLVDIMVETTATTISNIGAILDGGSDTLQALSDTAGKNSHARVQYVPIAFFFPGIWGGNWGFSSSLTLGTQYDVDLRNNFTVDPASITDMALNVSVGRKLMRNRLSVGISTHVHYRIASQEGFSFVDIIRGNSLSPLQSGGDGGSIDFDLGATYELPMKPLGFNYQVGLTINNILGGKFTAFDLNLAQSTNIPRAQFRALGIGVSAAKPRLWKFSDAIFAFELTDIGGLNRNGSLFKTVHVGGEVNYGLIKTRLGLNQGYLSAGLGFNFKVVTLELATYGEEMSLNVGGLQDRRFALRFGVQI